MFVIGAFSIVEVLKFHPKETHFHISMVKYIGKLPSIPSCVVFVPVITTTRRRGLVQSVQGAIVTGEEDEWHRYDLCKLQDEA